MEQLLIIIQGLAYSGLVVTLLSNRLARARRGAAPILGAVQIITCTAFDAVLVKGAAGTARFLATRPAWLAVQRYVLGAALALIAAKLAFGEGFSGARSP